MHEPKISPSLSAPQSSSETAASHASVVRPLAGSAPAVRLSSDGGAAPHWRNDSREVLYRAGTRILAAEFHIINREAKVDPIKIRVKTPVELERGNRFFVAP